ncbi:MAG: hypothetical protein RDU20_08015 [Desulfomonilaceae bacterium]|nr:hypothetical protein [Desulfomonilaceae bacterium]
MTQRKPGGLLVASSADESFPGVCSHASIPTEALIRKVFWILGASCGAILAYTTRHFVNGDAIAYVDMAEAFRLGEWADLVNLTYAPGYSVLLGILRSIVPDANEFYLAKVLNFLCFLGAMAACDLFMNRLRIFLRRGSHESTLEGWRFGSSPPATARTKHGTCALPVERGTHERNSCLSQGVEVSNCTSLPMSVILAIGYSAFLVAALVWVKIQIITPDLLVFTFVLLCGTSLLMIRREPERFVHFGSLGLFIGLGYIFKTFFFPFSAVFFLVSALCCRSLRAAAPRLMFGMAVMLVVSAPVVIAQSMKAGRLSFGESGSYNYTQFVAGRGERIHHPEVLHRNPDVLWYNHGKITTIPNRVDPAYWGLGTRPALDLHAQAAAIWKNLKDMLGRIFMPTAAILIWFCAQWWGNGISRSRFLPPSLGVILLMVAAAGSLMYCLVVMEIRYVAPFVFLGFVALTVLPRYRSEAEIGQRRVLVHAGLLVIFFLGTLAHSMVDQTVRAQYTFAGKRSHRELFLEAEAMREFLLSRKLVKGDTVAIVSPFSKRFIWASRAGLRIRAELTNGAAFLEYGNAEREAALAALTRAGFKAVVSTSPLCADIGSDGCVKVPGTRNYFVQFLNTEMEDR